MTYGISFYEMGLFIDAEEFEFMPISKGETFISYNGKKYRVLDISLKLDICNENYKAYEADCIRVARYFSPAPEFTISKN